MSPPAQNALPSALTSTMATDGSSSQAARAVARACTMGLVSALRDFGRDSVTIPARPLRSKRISSPPPKSIALSPSRINRYESAKRATSGGQHGHRPRNGGWHKPVALVPTDHRGKSAPVGVRHDQIYPRQGSRRPKRR